MNTRTPAGNQSWEKTYRDPQSADMAAANYEWLASLTPPLRIPDLICVAGPALRFERLEGRHVVPDDLVDVAGHLGDVHAAAHQLHLQQAHLCHDFTATLSHRQLRIPGFLTGRLDAVTGLLDAGAVPAPLLDAEAARTLMTAVADQPAAIYKDSNPRNLLISQTDNVDRAAPATVDFDDLTLAPFGYDLAKLVVGVAMTSGQIAEGLLTSALDTYNCAVRQRVPSLPVVTLSELLVWAEVHHVLTYRYTGRHGYRHGWHQVRPAMLPKPARPASAGTTTSGRRWQ